MRIEIETDGTSEGTVIKFDGKPQPDMIEFAFSVRATGKAKMQILRMDEKTNKTFPESYYANDFEKFGLRAEFSKDSLIGSKVNKAQ